MDDLTQVMSVFENSLIPTAAVEEKNAIISRYGVQERHNVIADPGPIRKLALSEDGNTIAGAATNTVCLWNTRTRQRIERLIFDNAITHMAISGDGQGLIVADSTNAIYAIDTSFAVKVHVASIDAEIVALGTDASGSYAVCADGQGTIRVFHSVGFECALVFDCGQEPRRLAVNADVDQLVVDTIDSLLIFSLKTGDKVAEFGAHNRLLVPERIANSLLAHRGAGSIRIFNPRLDQSGTEISTGGFAADHAPGSNMVVTTRGIGITIWDGCREERIKWIETYISAISDIKLSSDSQTIYVCGDDSTIDYYSTRGERLGCLSDLYKPVMAADITACGRQLVVADQGGVLSVYDLVSGCVQRYHYHSCCISKLCVMGSWAATGAHDGSAKVVNIDTGELIASVECGGVQVQAVALDPKGMLITGNYDGQIQCHDLRGDTPVREFYGNKSSVRSLCVSPCGRYLLSTSASGDALVFDYESGRLLNRLCDPHIIYTGCFDGSGEFIFYGCHSGHIVKAMSTTAKVLERWQQHTTHVRSITVQDQLLCSIGIDDDARILDMSSGETLLHCPVSSPLNHRVAFLNGDGSRLVTGGQNGRIMFHDTEGGSVLAELHNLGQGFLWTARNTTNDFDANDLFWTDRPELIQVFSEVGGSESLLSPSDPRHRKYLQTRNSKIATMARVGMCQEATKHDSSALAQAQRSAFSKPQERMLLEHHSG